MNTVLIILAIVFFLFQSAALRNVKTHTLRQNILSTATSSGIIAAALLIWALIVRPPFSIGTLIYGVLFGTLFVATLEFYYFAMQSGPLSYTGFFFSASMLIPSVAGLLFWGDPLNWKTIVGILLFLAAFYCITVPGGAKGGTFNKRWLFLCALTFIGNGSLSVVMYYQHQWLNREKVPSQSVQMMLVSFASACLLSLLLCLCLKGKGGTFKEDGAVIRKSLLPIALVAIGTGGGNILTSYLSGVVAASYLYPVVQGGTMLSISLYSMIVLREKVNLAGKLGILIGVCAIVLLNL